MRVSYIFFLRLFKEDAMRVINLLQRAKAEFCPRGSDFERDNRVLTASTYLLFPGHLIARYADIVDFRFVDVSATERGEGKHK